MLFFNQVKSVIAPEAKKMIESDDVAIIDVRSKDAYEREHVEGALLADKENLDHVMRDIDKSKTVICYCYKGMSSLAFCKKLKKAGYTHVFSLRGGFDAWEKFSSQGG